MAEFFESRKIDDQIADGDARTRFASFWLKNPEGKVLDREMRFRRNVDE